MEHTAQVIYKRINIIKKQLTFTDNNETIVKAIEAQGIPTTKEIVETDIRGIYRGSYPDEWLDNFLNVIYPNMFKETIEDLKEIQTKLKEYTHLETNSSKNVITALNSQAKIDIELISLMHKAPSVKMMRNLKVKADKLARALEEERTITTKNTTLTAQ